MGGEGGDEVGTQKESFWLIAVDKSGIKSPKLSWPSHMHASSQNYFCIKLHCNVGNSINSQKLVIIEQSPTLPPNRRLSSSREFVMNRCNRILAIAALAYFALNLNADGKPADKDDSG